MAKDQLLATRRRKKRASDRLNTNVVETSRLMGTVDASGRAATELADPQFVQNAGNEKENTNMPPQAMDTACVSVNRVPAADADLAQGNLWIGGECDSMVACRCLCTSSRYGSDTHTCHLEACCRKGARLRRGPSRQLLEATNQRDHNLQPSKVSRSIPAQGRARDVFTANVASKCDDPTQHETDRLFSLHQPFGPTSPSPGADAHGDGHANCGQMLAESIPRTAVNTISAILNRDSISSLCATAQNSAAAVDPRGQVSNITDSEKSKFEITSTNLTVPAGLHAATLGK